jgi:hypothetical protein
MDRPTILASAMLAYSDTARAIRAMPALLLVALIVGGGRVLVERAFGLSVSDTALTGKTLLIKLVVGVAYCILLAPVWIAIYRFVILNEVTRRYALDTANPRFQIFCAWSIVFFLLFEALGLVVQAIAPDGDVRTGLEMALVFATFAVTASLALLFPAIAADAPAASLRNAFADLAGSFGRAFTILLAILLPITIVALAGLSALGGAGEAVASDVAGWLLVVCLELLWAAAAARLYMALAVRLRAFGSSSL